MPGLRPAAGEAPRSGVSQAHRAAPGSRRVREVDDWLAGHLNQASDLPASPATPVEPGNRHVGPVDARSSIVLRTMPEAAIRQRRRRGGIGRTAVAAIALGAIAIVTVSMAMVMAGSAATAAVTSPSASPSASPSPSPTVSQSPVAYFMPTPTPTPPRSITPIEGSVFGTYVVRAGDTLTKIAQAFGLSVTTVYWANAAAIPNPHLIITGQKLLVPPVDGFVATVAHGDTLQSLADKYGIDPQVIADANELPATTLPASDLTAGQTLILPGVPNKPLPIALASGNPIIWLNKLEWPVPSSHHLTLLYGCTTYAAEPRFGSCRHWHDAVDVGAHWGAPVVAAAAGTVIYAGRRKAGSDGAGGGIVVWISHGGTLYTTYNHLSAVTVKAGQRVQAGQEVGKIGNTGASEGSHLHFEVWTDYPWTGGSMADAKNPLLYTKWKP